MPRFYFHLTGITLLTISQCAFATGEEGAVLLMMDSGSSSECKSVAHGPYAVVSFPTPHMVEVIGKESRPALLHIHNWPDSEVTYAGFAEMAKCQRWRVAAREEASMVFRLTLKSLKCDATLSLSVPKHKTQPRPPVVGDAMQIARQQDGSVRVGKGDDTYLVITP